MTNEEWKAQAKVAMVETDNVISLFTEKMKAANARGDVREYVNQFVALAEEILPVIPVMGAVLKMAERVEREGVGA